MQSIKEGIDLTVTLLVYHEEENLSWILPEIKKYVDQLGLSRVEYLIVDSMEPTDNTKQVCEEFGARYVNQKEPNYGGAMRTAYQCAKGDVFLILDADGSQDYTQIPRMYSVFDNETDVVIGSRYVDGGKTDDYKISQLMSLFLNAVYRVAMGIDAKDVSGSFRMYHTKDIKRICLMCENFDIAEEILFKLKLQKGSPLQIKEVPISFVKRKIGESKRSLTRFIVSYAKTLVYMFFLRLIARKNYSAIVDDKNAWKAMNVSFSIFVVAFSTGINVIIFLFILEYFCFDFLLSNIISCIMALLSLNFLNGIFCVNSAK